MADAVGALNGLPAARAWIGVSYRCFAIKYGPNPPEKVGEFLTRLLEQHKGSHPFFFSVECDPVDDPVPQLLALAAEDPDVPVSA